MSLWQRAHVALVMKKLEGMVPFVGVRRRREKRPGWAAAFLVHCDGRVSRVDDPVCGAKRPPAARGGHGREHRREEDGRHSDGQDRALAAGHAPQAGGDGEAGERHAAGKAERDVDRQEPAVAAGCAHHHDGHAGEHAGREDDNRQARPRGEPPPVAW